jgi:hypothetical protein
VDRHLQELVDFYADKVIEWAGEQAAVEDKKLASKSNVNKVETRQQGKRSLKNIYLWQKIAPCRKRIRLEV